MKHQGSEPEDSIVGLVASFVGINVMLAGLAVVLAPHLVISRIRRAWRARRLASTAATEQEKRAEKIRCSAC